MKKTRPSSAQLSCYIYLQHKHIQDSLLSHPNASLGYLCSRNLDANDESLQRYKESLGLGGGGKDLSDPNDPRHCIILSLTMNSEGRPPVTIDLSKPGSETTLKDKPFKIKEGAKFTMTARFKVQHQILSGLHYVQVIKRKGIRVSKDQEMLVSSRLASASRSKLALMCPYLGNRDRTHQIRIRRLRMRSAVSLFRAT